MGKEKAKNLSLKTYLITPINFTDDDLETNRNGWLSKMQQLELEQRQRFWKRLVDPAIGIAVLPIVLIICLGITNHLPWSQRADWYSFFIMIIMASGVTIALYSQKQYRAFEADLASSEVSHVQGWVKLVASIGDICRLTIEDQVFTVNRQSPFVFKNDDPYCLYYAPHSRTLLSAEWLRED